jgi:uncharacterized protein YkwD
MRRGVCSFSAVVACALLATSAAAVTTDGRAPLPSKAEVHLAGRAMFKQARASVDRRNLRRFAPAARTVVLARPADTHAAGGPAVTLSALESSLLVRVNAVRRRHGLGLLKISRGLMAAADYHSQQMIQHGFFEHESRDGGAFWKRVQRFYGSSGFRSWEVGENLAYGSPDLGALATVRMWMNSPGHRENLLSRRWREIGLGAVHVESAGGEFGGSPVTVITADFGARVR